MSEAPIVLAFTAGVLAALNPCAFALLPAWAAYYASHGLDDSEDSLARLVKGLRFGALATIGFVGLFGTAGALVAAGVSAVSAASAYLSAVAAIFLGIAGTLLVLGHSIRLSSIKAPTALGRRKGALSMVGFGAVYGIASLACTLPVFLLVVGTATAEPNFLGGLALFGTYAVGMGAVLTVVATGVSIVRGAVIERIRPLVSRASGLALIAAAVYLLDRVTAVGLPGLGYPPAGSWPRPWVAVATVGVLVGVAAGASALSARRRLSIGRTSVESSGSVNGTGSGPHAHRPNR